MESDRKGILQKMNRARKPGFSRDKNFRKSYGMSLEELEERLKKQNSQCPICGKTIRLDVPQWKEEKAVVDHNHKTGKFRSLLCRNCNLAIGLFNESIDILVGAAIYLREFYEEENRYEQDNKTG